MSHSNTAGVSPASASGAASSQASRMLRRVVMEQSERSESLKAKCLMNDWSQFSSFPESASRLMNWKNTSVRASSLHPRQREEGRRGNDLLFHSFTLLLSFLHCFGSGRRAIHHRGAGAAPTSDRTVIYLFILSLHFLSICFSLPTCRTSPNRTLLMLLC